jgi:hypothetical protein
VAYIVFCRLNLKLFFSDTDIRGNDVSFVHVTQFVIPKETDKHYHHTSLNLNLCLIEYCNVVAAVIPALYSRVLLFFTFCKLQLLHTTIPNHTAINLDLRFS